MKIVTDKNNDKIVKMAVNIVTENDRIVLSETNGIKSYFPIILSNLYDVETIPAEVDTNWYYTPCKGFHRGESK